MPTFDSALAVTGDCPDCGCGDIELCRVCSGIDNPPSFDATITLVNFGTYSHLTGSPDIDPAYSGEIACTGSEGCVYPLETERAVNELEWDLFVQSGWVALGCFGNLDGQTVNLADTGTNRCFFNGSYTCTDSRTVEIEGNDVSTTVEVNVFIELNAISTANFTIKITNWIRINGFTVGSSPFEKTTTVDIVANGYTCDGSGFVSATIPFDTGPLGTAPDLNPSISGTIVLTAGI